MNAGILLGLVFFAVIIYFMMRKGGGCCGHSHGEHNNPEGDFSGESGAGSSKDPVCGMTVAEAKAAGTSEYGGGKPIISALPDAGKVLRKTLKSSLTLQRNMGRNTDAAVKCRNGIISVNYE